jgi:hypothetical protein
MNQLIQAQSKGGKGSTSSRSNKAIHNTYKLSDVIAQSSFEIVNEMNIATPLYIILLGMDLLLMVMNPA